MSIMIEQISSALNAAEVQHSALKRIPQSNNSIVTDEKHVFMKVAPVHSVSQELAREASFLTAEGKTLGHITPLIPPFDVWDEAGRSRTVVAYRYVAGMENFSVAPVRTEVLSEAIAGLQRIWDIDYQAAPKYKLGETYTALESRARMGVASNPHLYSEKTLTDFLDLASRIYAACPDFQTSTQYATCHGDPHLGNFMFYEGQYHWGDFEFVMQAPRELDIAAFSLDARYQSEAHMQAWDEAVRGGAFPDSLRLDWDLVRALTLVRGVTNTSYALLPDTANFKTVFERRVVALEEAFSNNGYWLSTFSGWNY